MENKMKTTDSLIIALVKAQQEIDHVVQDGNNPFFKSDYATLKEVIDSVKKPLNDNGILLQQVSHDCDNGACVETIFYGHGGLISTGRVTIPASKQDPQAYGSALSYAKRYSLLMACGVATKKEDDDAEAAMQRNKPKAKVIPVKKAKFKFEKTGGETLDADNIEDYLLILASNLGDPSNVLHKKAYASNRDNVLVALESTNMGDKNHARIEKLISLYEGE
ncbi:MAG: hypothetical protein CMJ25_19085 [Phycisphaerae bacterium]|nr:hypothetical protein [Phycisphaerae bacterium]|tara:strand:- start:338 stop:1000 length:663 start_codon:yes stop_codon:yes gene_type:complete